MLLSTGQPTISDAQQSGATAPERASDQVLARVSDFAPLVARRGLEIERLREGVGRLGAEINRSVESLVTGSPLGPL